MKEVIVSITFDHIGCHKLDGKEGLITLILSQLH